MRQIVTLFSRAERDEIMSDVYSLEPPTSGKVILHTTHGEIDIELFSKECPLACRAFVQLCLRGYYEQNVFHRIVKGFMVQTGDKTGTGKGNGWEEGKKFKDEFHSRISFNKRGQVAMANEGKRDSNGSQFFITLEQCRHLDRKHTIFGKVAGQTFYNVQRIGECECEGETPVGEPLPRIVRAEVVWNPFADIVAVVPEEKTEEKKEQPKAKKKKQKANVGLLSFGDDEEVVEDEDERKEKKAKKQKIASAHDVVEEGSNKKFAKVDDEEYGNVLKKTEEETRENEKKAKDLEEKMKAKMREKREKVSGNGGEKSSLAMLSEMNVHISEEERKRIEKAKKAREKQAKAERKLERERHKKNKLKKLGLGKALVTEDDKALMSNHEVKRAEAKLRNRRVVDREKDTLAKLQKFNEKLHEGGENKNAESNKKARDGFVGVSKFVPEGLYYMEDVDEDGNEIRKDDDSDDDDKDWRAHSLKFDKDGGQSTAASHYLASADDYEVLDPRKPLTGEIGTRQAKNVNRRSH